MFLLDTSVLIRLRTPLVLARINELDSDGLARTSMTDLEIGFSARNAEEWDRLVVALGVFRHLDVEAHHFGRARQVQRLLANDGLKGRKVPDLLIAAVAENCTAGSDQRTLQAPQRAIWSDPSIGMIR